MKIWNKEGEWNEKVNFVDENNLLLGYDLSQHCCEDANWFISEKIECKCEAGSQSKEGLENYSFDPAFFEERKSGREFDEGGIAIFRVTDGDNEKFIHIFNCHNGYYGHGFYFSINGVDIQTGTL